MKKIDILKHAIVASVCLILTTSVNAQRVEDKEIKKNVESIQSPLQKLLLLDPKVYEYNTSKYRHLKLQPGRQYGFLAEDMQQVFPEAVSVNSVSYMFGKNAYRTTSYQTVDGARLIPVLVAAIKEQQQQIDELKAAVEALRSKTIQP